MPVLLTTDLLFFAVLFGFVVMAWRMARQEHLRRPWRKVAGNRSAMVSLVILLAYLLIAVLDSLRFYPSNDQGSQTGSPYIGEPVTLLDQSLGFLRNRTEKTYSSPLAVYGFAREMIRESDGREHWGLPRLQFAGTHLADPGHERVSDVVRKTLLGFAKGFSVWLFVACVWHLWRRHRARQDVMVPWGVVGLTLLGLCTLSGVLAELGAHYHVLGTGKVGEDVLYQSLKSIRTGILIGTLTTFATLPLALVLGVLAGYSGGWVDDVIQYLYATLNSIPGVLLIAAAMLVMQSYMAKHEAEFASLALRADFRLLALCLILGMTSWTGLCRLLRAETLKLKEMEYIQASRVLGVSQSRILMRHILPNLFHLVLISITLDFSSLVLAEAVLSYINIGVDPAMESWGNMINSARLEMAREPVVWWSLMSAFCFMFILVLSANLFADAVRDAFDPRRVES